MSADNQFSNEEIADACLRAVDLLKMKGRTTGVMKESITGGGKLCMLGAVAEALGLDPFYCSCAEHPFFVSGFGEERFGTVVQRLNKAYRKITNNEYGWAIDFNDKDHSSDHDPAVYNMLAQLSDELRKTDHV